MTSREKLVYLLAHVRYPPKDLRAMLGLTDEQVTKLIASDDTALTSSQASRLDAIHALATLLADVDAMAGIVPKAKQLR